jgi:hypothetical protein
MSTTPSDYNYVCERVQRGDRVKFMQDFYGGYFVEVKRRWALWGKRRVRLSQDEFVKLKAELSSRRANERA